MTKKASLWQRAYDSTRALTKTAIARSKEQITKGKEKIAQIREKRAKEKAEREVRRAEEEKIIADERERLMPYGEHVIKGHKKHIKRSGLRNYLIGGLAFGSATFGAFERYAHDPIKQTATIAIYTGNAVKKLSSAAANLGKRLTGKSDSKEIKEAAQEFAKADEQYFQGLRGTLGVYQRNIDDREHKIHELMTLSEEFGRISRNAPGYQSLRESGFTSLRDKINSLMTQAIGAQSKGEINDRLSREYETKFNELLKMVAAAEKKRDLNKEEIAKLSKKMAEAAQTMGKLNEQDKRRLTQYVNDTNELYGLTKGMRQLNTGQIRQGSREYNELVSLGKKYQLNVDNADQTANAIAYGIGALLSLYVGRIGGGLGRRFLPTGRFNLEKTTDDYIKQQLAQQAAEKKRKNGPSLDEKLTIIVALSALFTVALLNAKVSGFSIADNISLQAFNLTNIIMLLIVLFLVAVILYEKIFKSKSAKIIRKKRNKKSKR